MKYNVNILLINVNHCKEITKSGFQYTKWIKMINLTNGNRCQDVIVLLSNNIIKKFHS